MPAAQEQPPKRAAIALRKGKNHDFEFPPDPADPGRRRPRCGGGHRGLPAGRAPARRAPQGAGGRAQLARPSGCRRGSPGGCGHIGPPGGARVRQPRVAGRVRAGVAGPGR